LNYSVKRVSLSYVGKRLIRSWQLYVALLLGVVLASTFFAGINVGADTAAKQALDQALSQTQVDMTVSTGSFRGKAAYGVISSKNVTDILQRINSVDDVANSEVQSSIFDFSSFVTRNFTCPSRIIGITEKSRVYDGWIGGKPNITENQVYVWAGSRDASKLQVGDVLQINVTATSFDMNTTQSTLLSFLCNLTVGGFAQLTDEALSLVSGGYDIWISSPGGQIVVSSQSQSLDLNIMIADWEKTFASLLDRIYEFSPAYSNPVGTEILIYLNRAGLVFPWDIGGSLSRVKAVEDQITERLTIYNLQPTNNLGMILDNFQYTATKMRVLFITASVPVFFVAWYMGSTVSDVSVNLRRREIGLLLTKGFSKRQLLGIFLTEAILIGLVGGFIGIALGFVLNPIFVTAAGGTFIGSPYAAWDTLFLTVAFAILITVLSTFQSARKAQNIAAIDALRQYMYVEETKPYKRIWPVAALALGTFKMIILLIGVNMFVEMQNAARAGSMLISILAGLAFILDSLLTAPIGPWLFAWGLTKLLVRGSVKFQELTSRAFKFLGDLGSLATKNVQRNPARSAAVAFLVTLIVAYSFQITGTLASQQDFTARNILFEVGSDVSVRLSGGRFAGQAQSGFNVTAIVEEIERNQSDFIASTTVEYLFMASVSNHYFTVKAVDSESWLATAYYENQWFTGRDAQTSIGLLKTSNETIVLERSYALIFNKNLDDYIAMSIAPDTKELKIVGFFGNEPPLTQGPYIFGQGTISVPSINYWSYVPYDLLKTMSAEFGYNEARILIKLKEGASGGEVADKIRGLNLNISTVDSVEERLDKEESDIISTGQLNVLRLGVIFAVLASSVGTALVTLVSLREREREASIMCVRGLSFKQLSTMLLAENIAIIAFAALLGTLIGFAVVRGTIISSNASGYLVTQNMVFPPDITLLLLFSFVLIFASTILPVIFMSKRFSSRLERIVRQV
jgi:ABC-type antimicrobial peptide transport system permease subunit